MQWQLVHRLKRKADALDSIEQQRMPLSYKFTLILATPQLSSLLAWTLSLCLSHSLPAAHMHPQIHVHTSAC